MNPENTQPAPDARWVAGQLVEQWLRTRRFPADALDAVVRDRGAVMEMACGVLRRRRALDWVLARHVRRIPPPFTAALLLVGLYQLLFMDDVEEYAAVNETVEAIKRQAGRAQAGFANAVFRTVLRERASLREELDRQPLGVRTSHPDPLVARWVAAFGEARAARLCDWNNRRPDTVLRVRTQRIALDAFAARLRGAGLEVAPHPARPVECLILPRGARVEHVPGYAEGLFVVQDPATLGAVDLLDLRPGQDVLDACAAPGGKSAAIADRLDAGGTLVAGDHDAARLATLRENLARLRLAGVTVLSLDMTDAAAAQAALGEGRRFDRILLDVPCMNTGVIRRKPDVRWRFSSDRLQQMLRTQRKLLDVAGGLLRPGGRMVYSTCSLEAEENGGQIDAWLAGHPDFRRCDERFLFPPDSGTDGAYAVALEKAGPGDPAAGG